MTNALKDNVAASREKKVVAVTSNAGSMSGIFENIGGYYFYRASKSALNNVMRAMGVDLRARNLAQVSMNLTDFEQTPVGFVFEMLSNT